MQRVKTPKRVAPKAARTTQRKKFSTTVDTKKKRTTTKKTAEATTPADITAPKKKSTKAQQLDQLLTKHQTTTASQLENILPKQPDANIDDSAAASKTTAAGKKKINNNFATKTQEQPELFDFDAAPDYSSGTHNVAKTIRPVDNPFLGPSDRKSLAHAFNPDLSKAQLYEKSVGKKINAIDLTASPTTLTGQQNINRKWGIQDVITFLSAQKIAQMVVFDTSAQSSVCDYTIVCNASSARPMAALAQKLVAFGRMNKGPGYDEYRAGDDPDGLWCVAELGHIVVHILTPAGRTSPMFQRVERKLLNDANLISISSWKNLLDPWDRQDKQIWDEYSAGKMLDWTEIQAKHPHLQGLPPPPGYYIRGNTKAIAPNYDNDTDVEEFDYLDINEKHLNKINFLNEVGYKDHTNDENNTQIQIDYDMIDKEHFGKVEIIKPKSNNVDDAIADADAKDEIPQTGKKKRRKRD